MPKTVAGQTAWDVLQRCATQVRTAGMGTIIGLDYSVALPMAEALGYRVADVARLLPWAEAGWLSAINQNDDGANE